MSEDNEKKFSAEFLSSGFLEPVEKRIGEKLNAGENAKEIAREMGLNLIYTRQRMRMIARLYAVFTSVQPNPPQSHLVRGEEIAKNSEESPEAES